uniref:Uncharacterized protein n=1 Tax=Phenylobacterium glaciei TaxID=2803784 RepID=A0A974S9A9_9CAUL|nr:hypothetical protein JKL49_02355 [Phenylobacterium glaciei]
MLNPDAAALPEAPQPIRPSSACRTSTPTRPAPGIWPTRPRPCPIRRRGPSS